jgi:hypothetical protein
MKKTKGIRWPSDLEGVVEKAAIEDDRSFSSEVIHLVRLGLTERAISMAASTARINERLSAARPSNGSAVS